VNTDILRNKNVKIVEIPKWGAYLRKQWERHFASHLSSEEKRAINLYDSKDVCGYLWHLFSYEKTWHLEGKDAELAFNSEPKGDCYVFYQHSDYALLLEKASNLKSSDFLTKHDIDKMDIYIVDKNFRWTYVQTHESGWLGPYFCRR